MPAADLPFRIAFLRIRQIGPMRLAALERAFGSLEEAWKAPAGRLRDAGIDETTSRAVVNGRPGIDPEAELPLLEKHGVRALLKGDPEYPPLLRELDDAPPVLFVKGAGDPGPLLAVAVVGTRRMTPYGRQASERFSRALAQAGIVVVSGLARGVDAIAHRAALDAGGKTNAVLANGLDSVYPPEHARLAEAVCAAGALISEYPIGVKVGRDFFPRRNRIISGVSMGILVVEGAEDSGALITARHGLDQNREVFAIPGSVFSKASDGANLLIQKGEAKLVRDVMDILVELNLSVAQSQPSLPIINEELPASASEAEQRVLRHLSDQPTHIDDVLRSSGLSAGSVSSALQILELKGIVRQVGGMSYIRI